MIILFVMRWACLLSGAAHGAIVGWTCGMTYAFAGLLIGLLVGGAVGLVVGVVGSAVLVVPVILILTSPYALAIKYGHLAQVPSRIRRAYYVVRYWISVLFLISVTQGTVLGAGYAAYRSVSWLFIGGTP